MIVAPKPLSWSRLRRLSRSKRSILREMEHEIFETITLEGLCLDVGGGAKASYLGTISNRSNLHSVNIDSNIAPSLMADLNLPFPFAEDSYDMAICFNVLEHIQNDVPALGEMIRVLKPGAKFHIIVPFLYQVHGAPSDFHRHTHHEWDRRLRDVGLDPSAYAIQPMVWDPVSSGYSVLESAVPRLRWLLRPLSLIPGLIYYKLRHPAHGWASVALGYYVSGRKQLLPQPAA